jgi:hypothetical protein
MLNVKIKPQIADVHILAAHRRVRNSAYREHDLSSSLETRKSPRGLFLVSSASIAALGLSLIFYQNRGFFS